MKSAGEAEVRPVPVMLMARELDQGGVERDVAKIAIHLDRSRFEPHVATYNAHGMRYEELRAAQIPILPLPLKSTLSRATFPAAVCLRGYLARHAIQVLHSYDVSGILGVPVARSLGIPAIISSQLSYRSILDWKTRWLLRMTDRISDAVLVNCNAIRQYMIEDERVPDRRVELCHNGVDTAEFYRADEPEPGILAGADLVIGVVCALRPEKALTLLQEAFTRTYSTARYVKLLIVGSGPELARLENNAARLGITDASIFVPATPRVAPWLRAIDIFVLPSYSEAFSNSLLEAMACGCAVIGSRVGGTPELTGRNEERGLLFTSGDAGELAAKLGLLVRNEALRRDLAARAACFVKENLTIEIAARRTAAIYEKLLRRY